MEAALTSRADIHAWAFTDSGETLKNCDRTGVVAAGFFAQVKLLKSGYGAIKGEFLGSRPKSYREKRIGKPQISPRVGIRPAISRRVRVPISRRCLGVPERRGSCGCLFSMMGRWDQKISRILRGHLGRSMRLLRQVDRALIAVVLPMQSMNIE